MLLNYIYNVLNKYDNNIVLNENNIFLLFEKIQVIYEQAKNTEYKIIDEKPKHEIQKYFNKLLKINDYSYTTFLDNLKTNIRNINVTININGVNVKPYELIT